jgi:hypothetical protein
MLCMLDDSSAVKLQTSALYVHGSPGKELRQRLAAESGLAHTAKKTKSVSLNMITGAELDEILKRVPA